MPPGPRSVSEADSVVPQALLDLLQLGLSPDEGRGFEREVAARSWIVASGGKPADKPGWTSWKMRSGRPRLLEAMLTEVQERRAVRQLVHDQGGRDGREQDLAAVARGHDPGRRLTAGPW